MGIFPVFSVVGTEFPQRKIGSVIIQTVHILQHDSAVTGSLPKGDVCMGIPNLLPNNLARHNSTVTLLYQ
jgi:hypothetical protein